MRGVDSSKIALATALTLGAFACTSVAFSPLAFATQASVLKKRSPGKKPVSMPLAPPPVATPAPVPVPVPEPPVSMLQQPPRRAQVHWSPQGLSVQAENSNLSQILKDISNTTGMKLEGFGRDERIFGTYGPGVPKDILGQLLEGTGYNVLMVGDTEKGAPRQLVLTLRNGAAGMSASAPSQVRKPAEEEETAEPEDDSAQQQPPDAAPQQQPGEQQAPAGVKTPQQLLEELRRMRDQNNQNPQQQPPEQPQ